MSSSVFAAVTGQVLTVWNWFCFFTNKKSLS